MADETDPPLSPDDAKLILNERTKLTATWLNGMAIAAVAVGALGPAVAVVIGTAPLLLVLGIEVVSVLIGVALHLGGRYVLARLKA